jgi:GNAT superfamily N-acetyltransferase
MGALSAPRPLSEGDVATGFECGRASLDSWFRSKAWSNQILGVSRTNVVLDDGRVVAFVTLSSGHLAREWLPKSMQRDQPNPVPMTVLGRLAVAKTHQGRGLGRFMLKFAFLSSIKAAEHVGTFGMLTHPADDAVRAFYARYGFVALPMDPSGGMVLRIRELRAMLSEARAP